MKIYNFWILKVSDFESEIVTESRLIIDRYEVPKGSKIVVCVTYGDFRGSRRNTLESDHKVVESTSLELQKGYARP